MPPALLSGTATGATRPDTAPARGDTGNGAGRRDFDALLSGDAGQPPARASEPAKPKAKADSTPASGNGQTPPGDTAPPASEERSEAIGEPDAAPSPASPPAAAGETDTTEETDTAPWPPLGLAGLLLTSATADAAPAASTGTAPAPSAAAAAPALPTALTPPVLPGATGPATPATDAGSAGAIALPTDLQAGDDAQLLKAVTDALAGGAADSADAPTPAVLHALQTAAEVKTSAVNALFTGSPTATPEVGADDFGDALSARIGWLADQKVGHATIKVTPHDLGQIEVRLQIDGDKVHASFSSAHAEVRHALETSLPRLRELLGEQGFQLGNADVGQQHTAQDGRTGGERSGQGNGGGGEPALAEVTLSSAQLVRQRGLLDMYA